ncbi:MAG: S9 family peptidase, partial [Bacteroidales bacterium]|nr:S9 family peptidase [Bacteroidales bacterium]
MKQLLAAALLAGCTAVPLQGTAQERLPEYLQAEKFTQEKLNHLLFSTKVDPHWFQQGDRFWFDYKTSEGTFWYVVDPASRSKQLLFDRDELAAQLTEIVRDPFEARHLPIRNLKAKEDGRTFTFEVTSTHEVPTRKDPKKKEKEEFYFSYDYPTRKLTHQKDGEKE